MNRNWSNQKAHPALKTKMRNTQNHKQNNIQRKQMANRWLTDWQYYTQIQRKQMVKRTQACKTSIG